MKQLILPETYNKEPVFELSKEDSHYLLKVQRKGIGYCFNLLDRDGNSYNGKIVDIIDSICHISVSEHTESPENKRSIILMQAIPKGKKIDLMIRQAVETGIAKFIPIMADHSIPQFKNDEEKNKKRSRWEKIVKEASQQSGSRQITKIANLQSFETALKNIETKYTGIFFHQVPLENKPLHQILNNPEDTIVLVVGPEGGLSQKEVALLKKYNFTPCLLGDNILRAETATTFSIGAVQMILLERENWTIK